MPKYHLILSHCDSNMVYELIKWVNVITRSFFLSIKRSKKSFFLQEVNFVPFSLHRFNIDRRQFLEPVNSS